MYSGHFLPHLFDPNLNLIIIPMAMAATSTGRLGRGLGLRHRDNVTGRQGYAGGVEADNLVGTGLHPSTPTTGSSRGCGDGGGGGSADSSDAGAGDAGALTDAGEAVTAPTVKSDGWNVTSLWDAFGKLMYCLRLCWPLSKPLLPLCQCTSVFRERARTHPRFLASTPPTSH